MRILKFALLPAAVAVFALASSANAAAERHYDCTKAGNANKAECKAAAKPAAAPAPAPAAAAKPAAAAPAPMAATKTTKTKAAKAEPGTRSAAQLANDNKMKACGAKWQAMGAPDKAKWDAKGKTMKDKNGKPETGWIAYSVDCRKSA